MATRGRIGILNDDGTVLSIYCHYDNYLTGSGRTLLEHYNDEAKVRELMKLGDISSLGSELGEKHPFDAPTIGSPAYTEYKQKYGKWCKAYGRDRGESKSDAIKYSRVSEFYNNGEEYNYLFAEGQWTVQFYKRPRMLLADALTAKDED
jgi:hypothetical protein